MNAFGRVLDIENEYSVDFIVNVLKENKTKHLKEYEIAFQEYNKDLKEALEKLKKIVSANLRKGKTSNIDNPEIRAAYCTWTGVKKPINAEKMYDQYITLFSTSVSDKVKLTIGDANAIINDEWEWAVEARASTAFYLSKAQ